MSHGRTIDSSSDSVVLRPSNGADLSRRPPSCFPPESPRPHPDGSQRQRTAVTDHRQGSCALTRKHSASWRTLAT